MTQHHDGCSADPSALFDPSFNQCRPDALALSWRDDGHWRQAHGEDFGMRGNDDWGEQDVTNDLAVNLRDERNQWLRAGAEGVHQVRLSRSGEGGHIDRANLANIAGTLTSN